jgi:hypothetical protein
MNSKSHVQRFHRRSKVKVEPQEAPKGDANDVVAADVNICDEGLPSTPHSYPYAQNDSHQLSPN